MERLLSFLLTTPYLLPAVLSLLALAVLRLGLPPAPRYRRPGRWRVGVVMTAVGLVAVWLLPAIVLMIVENQDLDGILLVLAVALGMGVLGGGLQAMSKANNTASDDQWDGILG